jgi:tetratricopeptide (TPR) repeat protein
MEGALQGHSYLDFALFAISAVYALAFIFIPHIVRYQRTPKVQIMAEQPALETPNKAKEPGFLQTLFKRTDSDEKVRWRWQPSPEEIIQRREVAKRKAEELRLKKAKEAAETAHKAAAEHERKRKEAHTKLRIFVDLIDNDLTSPKTLKHPMPAEVQLQILERASQYLKDARELDPTATVARKIKDDEAPEEFTIDMLTRNILVLEINMHLAAADAQKDAAFDIIKRYEARVDTAIKAGEPIKYVLQAEEKTLKDNDRFVQGHLQKARSAIEKYLTYSPNDVDMLRKLSLIFAQTGATKLAKETAQRALKLDPDDIQTIKLIDAQNQ